MDSGFVRIHFPPNTNTILLIPSPLTQCSFLLCFSCYVHLARGRFVGWGFFCGGRFGVFCWVFFKENKQIQFKKIHFRVKVSLVVWSFNYECLLF